MNIEGYTLENSDKVNRAVEKVGAEDESALLVEYDRLGGFITKGGVKVKNGSFFDLKLKKARKTPEVVLIYQVGDKQVEVPEGAVLPGEVVASQILAGQRPAKDLEEGEDEYDAMGKEDLKAELKKRDLAVGGKVEDLRARLRENDSQSE